MSGEPEKQMAGCVGKVAFKSRSAAQQQAEWMRHSSRSGKRRKPFDIYQCKFCGNWHFGHKP